MEIHVRDYFEKFIILQQNVYLLHKKISLHNRPILVRLYIEKNLIAN